MRIPYYVEHSDASEEEQKIVDAIKVRRGPTGLLDLDRALLHSPQMAAGWSAFLGSVRSDLELSADIKELAISRVAAINKAIFEWDAHSGLAIRAGVSEKGVDTLRHGLVHGLSDDGQNLYGLTTKQQVAVLYTDEMTKNVKVKDETFELVKAVFTKEQIVELTLAISAYNCVSRFLVALDINEQNERADKWETS